MWHIFPFAPDPPPVPKDCLIGPVCSGLELGRNPSGPNPASSPRPDPPLLPAQLRQAVLKVLQDISRATQVLLEGMTEFSSQRLTGGNAFPLVGGSPVVVMEDEAFLTSGLPSRDPSGAPPRCKGTA